jgi:hypothetical protein
MRHRFNRWLEKQNRAANTNQSQLLLLTRKKHFFKSKRPSQFMLLFCLTFVLEQLDQDGNLMLEDEQSSLGPSAAPSSSNISGNL